MTRQSSSLSQRPSLVLLPTECAKCHRPVTLTFQEGGEQVMLSWTCPYRVDCGRINYISFAGFLTNVQQSADAAG